jgi:hypothetical protein
MQAVGLLHLKSNSPLISFRSLTFEMLREWKMPAWVPCEP